MANEKFSEFTVQTDLSNFTGLVGFQTNTANYYITKSNFYNDLEANLDLTDFTTITGGAAGEVLTIDGAGTGLTWSTISVATPDIADVLTEGDTTSAGQKIEITPSAGTGTMKFWQYGIADSVTGGGNLDITKSTAGNIVVSAFGGNLILQSAAASTIQCNSDLNLQTNDLLDSTGGTGTAGQVLSSLGTGNGTEWVASGGGGGTVYGSFQGVMLNPGQIGTTAKPQLIFNDPLTSTSQAGLQIVPFDCEIETITMKWNGDTAPTIAIADGTTSWKIGKLTSNTGNADTSGGTVNFTDLTPTLAGAGGFEDLEISNNNGDSGTFIYKQWNGNPAEATNLPVALSAGDILIFIIIRGTGDWSPAGDEITVNFKYKLT